jgi:NOP5NT (NUC127) domain
MKIEAALSTRKMQKASDQFGASQILPTVTWASTASRAPDHDDGSYCELLCPPALSTMTLFILTETSAGYALLKAKDKKLLKHDDLASEVETADGICSL